MNGCTFLFCPAGPKAKAKAKSLAQQVQALKAIDFSKQGKEAEEGEEEEEFEDDEEVEPEEVKKGPNKGPQAKKAPKAKAKAKAKAGSKSGKNTGKTGKVQKGKLKKKTEDKRHYGKARKFQRMLKSGQIPDDIMKLYQDQALREKQPRLFRTQLINSLFQQDDNGEYVLCSDSPSFQAWKCNVDKKFSSQQTTGVPQMIMLWQIFHGNADAMKEAERQGQIFERGGLWHHASATSGREKSTADQMDLQGGSVDLDANSFAAMSNFLGKRDWAKYGEKQLGDSVQQLKRGKSTLALCDGEVSLDNLQLLPSTSSKQPKEPKLVKLTWKMLEKNIGDAKGANERLQRDCSRLVVKVRPSGDEKLIQKAKTTVSKLAENIAALNECQMWEEVPNTDGNEKTAVESFFGEIAQKTEEVNEALEELKAVCKARGL